MLGLAQNFPKLPLLPFWRKVAGQKKDENYSAAPTDRLSVLPLMK